MFSKTQKDPLPDLDTSEYNSPSASRGILLVVVVVAGACVAATILLALAIGSRAPQFQPMQVSPEILDFGKLRKDGIIEARIVLEQPSRPGDTSAPQIIPAAHISVFGRGGRRTTPLNSTYFVTRYQYIVRVDTSKSGDFESTIAISWNGEAVTVPVRYTVQNENRERQRVLIIETPFNGNGVRHGRVLDALRAIVEQAALDVEYHDSTQDKGSTFSSLDLTPYATILLAGDCLKLLTDPLMENKLTTYVKGGGTLIVAANAYLGESVQNANQILTNFGMEMQYKEVENSEVAIPGSDATFPELTGVSSLRFHRPSPILITDPSIAHIIVAAPEFPALAYIARGDAGDGEIVAIGQSQWWNWIGEERMTDFDNAKLLQNMLLDQKKTLFSNP